MRIVSGRDAYNFHRPIGPNDRYGGLSAQVTGDNELNTAFITELAERLEKLQAGDTTQTHEVGFNMGSWFTIWDYQDDAKKADKSGHACGTTACIAGHVVTLHNAKTGVPLSRSPDSVSTKAQEVLGLTSSQAYVLFHGSPMDTELRDTTPGQAAKVLRHLAATGYVDWTVVE